MRSRTPKALKIPCSNTCAKYSATPKRAYTSFTCSFTSSTDCITLTRGYFALILSLQGKTHTTRKARQQADWSGRERIVPCRRGEGITRPPCGFRGQVVGILRLRWGIDGPVLCRCTHNDGYSDRLTFFRSAARGLHVPARLTRESTEHEPRKRRASERPRVGCCNELAAAVH